MSRSFDTILQLIRRAARSADRSAMEQGLESLVYGENYRTRAGSPNGTVIPNARGEMLYDTTNSVWYRAGSTTNTSWKPVGPVRGTYTGNASTQAITCGFTPSAVEIFNVTDCDQSWVWFSQMSNDIAFQRGADSQQKLTSQGATPISTAGSEGFQIGTSLSENAKVFSYIAYP